MKKLLCILLAIVMLMSIAACGNDSAKTDSKNKTNKKTTTSATDAEGSTTAPTEKGGEDNGAVDPTEGEGSTAASNEGSTTATGGNATSAKPTDTTVVIKPTTTKPAPSDDDENALRVLAIGDEYTVDVMQNYLYDLLKGAGYDTVHLGILYASKGTIDTHYAAVKDNTKTYEFRQNNSDKWTKETKVAASTALKKAEWDYVVIQPSAADAGLTNTYGKLDDLTALIKKQCADTYIFWHMPWAFRRQSNATGFDKYKYNEKGMYTAIVDATLQQAFRDDNVDGILPTATTIQNLRTSPLRDQLTKDGMRLTDYGSYAAALTWYGILTGESIDAVTYRPAAIKDQFAELADAASNATSIPNEITPSKNEVKDLKILSIGHSFSLDAMRTYMWDLFDAAGYNVTIAYLYYPSCALEQHYHYISSNSASYEQYGKNENGEWVVEKNACATDALWDEDWDIVTFQPDPDYGHGGGCYCQWGCNKAIASDYAHFNEMVDKVKSVLADPKNPNGPNTDVKFYYHLTWTWRKDCYLYKDVSRGYDQQTLWQAFIDATKKYILPNENILGVIPCNTTIQNARTTWMGDTFNAEGSNDGYHLNDKGDLAAALTWVSYLTGTKASQIYLETDFTDAQFAAIAESVENAIANPEQVTQSKYKTEP